MKNIIITLIALVIGGVAIAQKNSETPQRLKYITEAPDGSIAMTIYDDTREDSMTLESASNFYRYEILEPSTSEPIYSAKNQGKACTIDKSKIAEGTYDLRLYTSSFVITSKITITAARKMKLPGLPTGDAVAVNNYDK